MNLSVQLFPLRYLTSLLIATSALASSLPENSHGQILRRRAIAVSVGQPVVVGGAIVQPPVLARRPFLPRLRYLAPLEAVPPRVVLRPFGQQRRDPSEPQLQPRPAGSPQIGANEVPAGKPRQFKNTRPPTPAGEPELAEAQVAYPTPAEIATYENAALLNTLQAASVNLMEELEEFSTGEGWQQYLQLSDDALPPAVDGNVQLGMRALQTTLTRMDSVARDQHYVKISSLPSFLVMHAALSETVERFAARSPQPAVPELAEPQLAAEESQVVPTRPTPQPALQTSGAPAGSILGTPANELAPTEAASKPVVSEEIPAPAPNPAAVTGPREHSVLKKIIRE
ncbi:polyadenylate binding domain-containing protein [Adhaeretor mobilis]|uniref:Secreted protein n=1 Tax=Adhaeretor mobilis TaxID=1930276 RepID=A0A517MRX9_9BACT|nr:hypothetical protein [Adhaeretor mobilis]QDS97639.1 hypothetical protein HG15A2_09030 [Adhaeretor mobilis]